MSEARAALASGMQITKAVSLLEPLSSGGMGAVWLADHLGLKTRVVVKFMLVGLDSSESARTRFSREAAAAAQVKSPHVVQMLDHGLTDDGVPFIVMEHLEGHDLGDEIEKHGALDPATVVVVVSQVAKALSKVHAAGLLHRDIKPDNIFLCEGEEDIFVKLLDFGIAKAAVVDAGDGSLDGETKTGQIVGTPFYMSPEQVTAQKSIDNRSDLWALGVVAYEALTGTRPYDGPSFGALAVKIATGDPPKVTAANPSLPPAVDAWFAKACARDPAGRFSTARELADGLRAAFDGVVSLPGVNSDSGQRSEAERRASSSGERTAPSGERNRSGSGSGERASGAPLGFAATALDDSDASRQKSALARSEAGLSLGGSVQPGGRSSPLLIVGGALALTAVVAIVLVLSLRSSSGPAPAGSATASASSVATATPSHAIPTITADPSIRPSATVAHVEPEAPKDAGPAAAVTSARIPPRPPGRPTASVPPTKPSETPPARPSARPTSTEPDLF